MESGCLSGFIAGPPDERGIPNGGPKVRELEAAWCERYGVKHAIAFNSATSGLLAACGAMRLGPDDVVICPPWTMSATVAAPMFYGAKVNFADIEDQTYCIDPDRVVEVIEKDPFNTSAVFAVNLFGHTAQVNKLKDICDERGMYLVEDCAQTPLATDQGKISGTVGDIGVYSLNRHKHIHCGEGGIAVTDSDYLAEGMRSVRNHGIEPLGLNLRMTELEAAIACIQLRDIDKHVNARREFGQALSDGLCDIMDVPHIEESHDFYLWTTKWKGKYPDLPLIPGYIQPLHWIFAGGYTNCPVVEKMRDTVICFETCKYDPSCADEVIEKFREAF